MPRPSIISKSFALTPIFLAAWLASSASGAPHDGPSAFCQTHIGWSYVAAGGLVHVEGSGLCSASADGREHAVHMYMERDTWNGWQVVAETSRTGLHRPFDVWLPLDRYACPGIFRGRVRHWAYQIGDNSRPSNQPGC